MKPTKGALIPYKPAPPPSDLPASAQRYLDDELNRIAAQLQGMLLLLQALPNVKTLLLQTSTEPPADPDMPALVFADGVSWDPGSGPGFYYWNMSVWTPLG